MKIGVLVAMDKEYEQLQGIADKDTVLVMKTGIGKVNAAIHTTQMISDFNPDVIVSSGCAGGAIPTLNVMDVVVSSRIAYHDVYCGIEDEQMGRVQGMPRYFETPQDIINKALSLEYDGTIHSGLIASGDWFVDTPAKLNEIKSLYPEAIAIDMESAAIAQTCYKFNVPFVSFRVISDVPTKENSVNDYNNFWTSVSEHSFALTNSFIKALQN